MLAVRLRERMLKSRERRNANWTNAFPGLAISKPESSAFLIDFDAPQMLNFSTPAASQCEHANGRNRLPWLFVLLGPSEAVTQRPITCIIKADFPFLIGGPHNTVAGIIGPITLANGVAEYPTKEAKGARTRATTSRHDGATSFFRFDVGSSFAADHIGQKAIYVTGGDFLYGPPSNEWDNMAL